MSTLNPDPREAVSLSLGPEERRLVGSLRQVPEGRLRAELVGLLDQLLASAREPRCAQMQADGVPCPCLGVACDECERALSLFRRLRAAARPV